MRLNRIRGRLQRCSLALLVVGTTVVVIVACFLFGFYLFLMDVVFSWAIGKIQGLFG